MDSRRTTLEDILKYQTPAGNLKAKSGHFVQSEEIICDPEMDKSAVWAGRGCMAVFLFPGQV